MGLSDVRGYDLVLLSIHYSTQMLDGYDRDDKFRFDALPSQILMSAFLLWAKNHRSRVFWNAQLPVFRTWNQKSLQTLY